MLYRKRLELKRRLEKVLVLLFPFRILMILTTLKNKEDASELLQQKAELEKRRKEADDLALQKEVERDRKIKTIGNYVHESVPVSKDEVC
jgi:seryl-tRNA synthetase